MAIRTKRCMDFSAFSDELIQLRESGFRSADHRNPCELNPGEFCIRADVPPQRFNACSGILICSLAPSQVPFQVPRQVPSRAQGDSPALPAALIVSTFRGAG
ncbi:hypothetical protein [Motiliproteus sp. SC1-56]|uniref:hypothetical protein n=1 Tax=Motiliproteus sp. SC1-56 TaxID=2799565 RepID=UPI001A8EACEC|nr:hypothetical protein [Motiliproteus sp. SC1-56]